MSRSVLVSNRSSGLTLVELLAVLLIITILGSLLFSVSGCVFDRTKRSRAVSELNAISVALESYRARFGDYPEVESARRFFDALDGKLGPRGQVLSPPHPSFLVGTIVSRGSDEAPELLDPWDRPYVYRYRAATGESRLTTFTLFSAGSDGKASPEGRGSGPVDDDNLWPDG